MYIWFNKIGFKRKSDIYSKSYNIKRRTLNNSIESSDPNFQVDEMENVIKHVPLMSKTLVPRPAQRNRLREHETLQTMSPNIKEKQIPQEDFCESDEFTPNSSDNILEEGSANQIQEEIKTTMVISRCYNSFQVNTIQHYMKKIKMIINCLMIFPNALCLINILHK